MLDWAERSLFLQLEQKASDGRLCPIGYKANVRSLTINETYAGTEGTIFLRYLPFLGRRTCCKTKRILKDKITRQRSAERLIVIRHRRRSFAFVYQFSSVRQDTLLGSRFEND